MESKSSVPGESLRIRQNLRRVCIAIALPLYVFAFFYPNNKIGLFFQQISEVHSYT